jgi:4-amino-4-deoxy-L-arabinose transferase-like glycosyltransferase
MILAMSNARVRAFQKRLIRMATSCSLIHRIDWEPVILIILALPLALWRLDTAPQLGWDEGWTLTVARTWVERGHYGGLLVGQPVSPGQSAAPPVVASVALSFRLLGVGVWQGRLVIVLYTLGALLLLYYLARQLYNRRIATGTLVVALLMSVFRDLHPMVVGRRVLAETPMLLFLLAGYACFLATLQKSVWFMPLTLICWGIGLNTKGQPLPFWTMSLVIPLVIMLFKRQWKVATLLCIALIGSLGARQLLLSLWQLLLAHQTVPGEAIPGIIQVHALVRVMHVRLYAMGIAFTAGLPTILGLGHAMWKSIGNRKGTPNTEVGVVRLALLILAGTWFAWYELLSIGWVRYLFPATFLGSMFVAALLYDFTDGFNLSATIKRGGHALRHRHFNRQGIDALLAIVLVATTVSVTVHRLGLFYLMDFDTSAEQVANFLNNQTAPNALIEANSSGIFFLLDRRYHYPTGEIHVQRLRRVALREDVHIDYDPLSADPDYLVVCHTYGDGILYGPVLETGAFRLLSINGPYEVYERVR